MNDLKNTILNKIKDGHIEPRSKWYFLTKNYLFWLLFTVSLIIGALAFSSVLFQVSEIDLRCLYVGKIMARCMYLATPYLWLAVFSFFLLVAWFNYKNTDKCYRHENYLVVMLCVLGAVLIGSLLFATGISKHMEMGMRKHMPLYKQHIQHKRERFEQYLEKQGYSPADLRDPELRKEIREDFRDSRASTTGQ